MRKIIFVGILVALAIFLVVPFHIDRDESLPQAGKTNNVRELSGPGRGDSLAGGQAESVAAFPVKPISLTAFMNVATLVSGRWFRVARQAINSGQAQASRQLIEKIAIEIGDPELFWQASDSTPEHHWMKNVNRLFSPEKRWRLIKAWPKSSLTSIRQIWFLHECFFRPEEISVEMVFADFSRYIPLWLNGLSFTSLLVVDCRMLFDLRMIPFLLLQQPSRKQRLGIAVTLKNAGWPWPELAQYNDFSEESSEIVRAWWIESGDLKKALMLTDPQDKLFDRRTLEDAALAALLEKDPDIKDAKMAQWARSAQKSFEIWQKETSEKEEKNWSLAGLLKVPTILTPRKWRLVLDSFIGEIL